MGALEAVEAEAHAGPEPVTVPLGDVEVGVAPVGTWRSSALRALRQGDFDTWAEKCLVGDDAQVWTECDPTLDEIEAFFAEWAKRSGQDLGKLSASLRSSKSTAGR